MQLDLDLDLALRFKLKRWGGLCGLEGGRGEKKK